MALINKQPKFETIDESGEIVEDASADEAAEAEAARLAAKKAETAARLQKAQAEQAASSPEAAAKAKPAELVFSKPHAVGVSIAKSNPFTQLENAFPIEFNTLRQIMATNGNFMDKDTSKPLGDVVGIEIISTQRHYVLTPSDDSDEAAEFLKYSDDGITAADGSNMREALIATKAAGYSDARITERVYLVGCLFESGKMAELQDTMVQIDLAPTSVAQFKRHQCSVAFNVGKGKAVAEGQERLRLECVVKTKGKMNWTEISFSQAK